MKYLVALFLFCFSFSCTVEPKEIEDMSTEELNSVLAEKLVGTYTIPFDSRGEMKLIIALDKKNNRVGYKMRIGNESLGFRPVRLAVSKNDKNKINIFNGYTGDYSKFFIDKDLNMYCEMIPTGSDRSGFGREDFVMKKIK